MKIDDQQLRDCFSALRVADAVHAPSFQRLVRGPAPDCDRKNLWFLPRSWIALGAGAAAFAVFAFSIRETPSGPDDITLEQQWTAVGTWNPPTDALLAAATSPWEGSSPTDELMETEPASSDNPTDKIHGTEL